MAATITDITTRTTAFGRVIDAMLTHQVGDVVNFVALGMFLRTQCTLSGWTVTLLADVAQYVIKANVPAIADQLDGVTATPYPFAKRFVVVGRDGVVAADAYSLRAALGLALELIYQAA